MSGQDTVRKASKAFYAALNQMANGNAAPMAEIWSHSATVTTMHPIGGREVGWANVKGPWEQVASMCSGGQVELTDPLIRVGGDMAYEVGVERGHLVLAGNKVAVEHRVTNVYRRGAGGWRIAHHHTDLSAAMLEVLRGLEARQ